MWLSIFHFKLFGCDENLFLWRHELQICVQVFQFQFKFKKEICYYMNFILYFDTLKFIEYDHFGNITWILYFIFDTLKFIEYDSSVVMKYYCTVLFRVFGEFS